jgi:VanZ family protein
MAERKGADRLLTTRWLLVALYIVVIFALSAQPGLKLPGDFIFKDKVAHALEYFGLSLLAFWAARGSWPAIPAGRRVWFTLAAIAVLGVSDELFQRTVPGRDSSPFDWMADLVGASIGQIVWLAFGSRRRGA